MDLVERLRNDAVCQNRSRGADPLCVAAADRIEALEAHIRDQAGYAETRIQDGIEMGATVWRIALEDIAAENRSALE